MHRKLIRPSLASRPSAGPAAMRRPPSPESTHAEAGYLLHAVESGAILVLEFLGGERLRGRLEGYDKDSLILAGAEGGSVVVRKDRLRAFWLEAPDPPVEP